MTARRPLSPFVRFLRQSLATGCAALVLLLATLAASPELHERFHGSDSAGTDDGCAVTLFASGVSLAAAGAVVELPAIAWNEPAFAAPEEIFLAPPRYLRQPARWDRCV